MLQTFSPTVKPEAEFLEICNDFTEPREVVREAISNAFDAGANVIKVGVHIDKSIGFDEMVLIFEDDGHGMDIEGVRGFFSLGVSSRRTKDERGFKISGAIGEKGHGTKIYFNSRVIEVRSVKDGNLIDATMTDPRQKLQREEMPVVTFDSTQASAPNGNPDYDPRL